MSSNEDSGKSPKAPKADHGPRSEVSWDGGAGRQPYANQGSEETSDPHAWQESPEGDRGELSGRNLEQLEQVKKKP
jgi:hypothetical protein